MSSFGWIDHSEKQRRQVLEAIDLFREKDTRDELGLAGIRDAISDAFFPGTGALQTRARYFFFVPWILQQLEAKRTTATDLGRRLKDVEIRLIETLLEADNADPGIIGRRARKSLARFPSSIYWNGLKVLQFTNATGALQEHLKLASNLAPKLDRDNKNDDGETLRAPTNAWHKGIPRCPDGFPGEASLTLTKSEAVFLKEQVLMCHSASLFAHFLNLRVSDSDCSFAWDQQAVAKLPTLLAQNLEMARTFSEVMHGASILYNRALAELEPRKPDYIDNCQVALDKWRNLIDSRQAAIEAFDRDQFWNFVRSCRHSPSFQTTAFVESWFRLVRDPSRRKNIETDRAAVDLVKARERQIKGPMARFDNRRVREMWLGESGMGQLNYRWKNAEWLINDLASAEGVNADA